MSCGRARRRERACGELAGADAVGDGEDGPDLVALAGQASMGLELAVVQGTGRERASAVGSSNMFRRLPSFSSFSRLLSLVRQGHAAPACAMPVSAGNVARAWLMLSCFRRAV